MELLRLLAGVAAIVLPGILLAAILRLGENRLSRFSHGVWLGLAMAIYLGSVISYFDLRWFEPAWIGLALVLIAIYILRKPARIESPREESSEQRWLILVLLLVAASRYAFALPDILPMGVDPPIFLIMARKFQMTHHAMADWRPFASVPLNYPFGAPTLVAIISSISGLPVSTVFKDFIPLLGVFGTAQVYVFARRVTGAGSAALYAATAYGLWAGLGSIDFYKWGGMPNEIAILLLLASLGAWLEDRPRLVRIGSAGILLAASILSHHHTQLAAAGIIAAICGWMLLRKRERARAGMLILAVFAAFLLDGFFLISYLPKIGALKQTNALYSEWPMYLRLLVPYMGLPFVLAAAAGAGFCISRRWRHCHPAMPCACVALMAMFATFEYVIPIFAPPPPPGHPNRVMFTPSHFLNDLPCFMAGFAGITIAAVQSRLRLRRTFVMAAMLLLAFSVYDVWKEQFGGSGVSADYVAACEWIESNTSADSIVRGGRWVQCLSWRRGEQFDLPDSERSDEAISNSEHIAKILAGKIPPDSPQMKEVEIVSAADAGSRPVLWKSPGGLEVVQDWPN